MKAPKQLLLATFAFPVQYESHLREMGLEIDNSHYKLILKLLQARIYKSITTARESILKLVQLQSLMVAKCCKMRKIQPCKVCKILHTFVLRAEIATIFGPNVVGMWQEFPHAIYTKVYKICKRCRAIFSAFYNISQPI